MTATVLLLASDPVIRNVLSGALESAGYVVLKAGDVGNALDRMKEMTPDLLIVRHYTESMTGHDAAMYLRKTCPGIPVLLLGGLLEDVSLEGREAIRGFEVFPKPFKGSELLDKVNEILSKRKPRRAAGCEPE
jgi:DNA-binding response OmpR family regulator